jgi:hypothetical protein
MYKTSIGALRDSCAAQSIGEIMAPTSGGVGGWGLRLGPGLSGTEKPSPFLIVALTSSYYPKGYCRLVDRARSVELSPNLGDARDQAAAA